MYTCMAWEPLLVNDVPIYRDILDGLKVLELTSNSAALLRTAGHLHAASSCRSIRLFPSNSVLPMHAHAAESIPRQEGRCHLQ
jgi:hypothetical protein